MKTRLYRENELKVRGYIDAVKNIYRKHNIFISNYYCTLIADYLASLDETKKSFMIDTDELLKNLPNILLSVKNTSLDGIYGKTENKTIEMEQNLDYETNKLFFFHELTHAIQTTYQGNIETCGFYNGKTGMFLTEAATQYMAEILYHVSDDTNIEFKNQRGANRIRRTDTLNSPLSQYQYNGNILQMMSTTMGVDLSQLLALSYKANGRDVLKQLYESLEGNEGKFENFMNELEQIYSIDKLILTGDESLIDGPIQRIDFQNKTGSFMGNIDTARQLLDKVQRNLATNFIENYDDNYILSNYQKLLPSISSDKVKQDFIYVVEEIRKMNSNQSMNL